MKFSEAIAILELTADMDAVTGLTTAYRAAMRKYHPDVTVLDLDFALEMTKTINAAYGFLIENMGKWSVADKGETNLADVMVDIYKKIRHLPNITIIPKGVWLWVTINCPAEFTNASSDTYEIRKAKRDGLKDFRKGLGAELREHGFKYAPNKKMWNWHQPGDGPRKWKRGSWSWDKINATFAGDELETNPHTAMA